MNRTHGRRILAPNPFVIPGRSLGDRRPLCPKEHDEHRSLYVAVDNSEASFVTAQGLLSDLLSGTSQLRLLLVCGPEGAGKTSLVNRCIDWLENRVIADQGRFFAIHLHEESVPGLASEAMVRHLVSRMIDKVGMLGLLTESEEAKLEARRTDPHAAVPFLAELLSAKNDQPGAKKALLAVVLPRMEVSQEMMTISDVARQPILFLSETAEDGLPRVAASMYGETAGSTVRTVSVGGLSVDDGWRFVESRLSLQPTAPVSDVTVLRRFMNARIQGRGMTTILELNLTCQQVWDAVERSSANFVTYADFQEFYLVKGRLA